VPLPKGANLTAALCPGSFDPPTNGHLDVIERALDVFDRVVVGVVRNPAKTPLLEPEERVQLLDDLLGGRAEVEAFEGLLVEFARHKQVDVVVKGLRVVSDFDYELQMAQMNRTLTGLETFLIPTNPQWSYLSSSLVREIALLGGVVDSLVPATVAEVLKHRAGRLKKQMGDIDE
jgi:pantetheine-phosphate adenylyltransferase